MASTVLQYQSDMWRTRSKAIVVAFVQNSGCVALVLDCTIFYPQGGGQPADMGLVLDAATEKIKFCVEDVRLKDDLVYHYGLYSPIGDGSSERFVFEEGQEVCLLVDVDCRKQNSRLHSAGHLLDICMCNVGLELEPSKGYHFPDGPFVEYKGLINPEDIAVKRAALEMEANKIVAAGGPVNAVTVSYDVAKEMCGGKLPEYISMDMKPRIVTLGKHYGCPCGGTHVQDISDIGEVKVSQIRLKKGMTRVFYSLAS